ncbi:MAG: Rieske 2Fe-2S domain-containing protein, partial [Pseudomonadota bacterium]
MSETVTLIHSLEAKYYTDPQVFEIENKGLLARTWQFAGHVSQLENAGDYFTFSIAGESLFCIKGKDGEIRAYYNVCQHRAH